MNEWKFLGLTIKQSHNCDSNVGNQTIRVLQVNNGDGHACWSLVSVRLASDQDVINGEAGEKDELLFSTQIAINFCPFCGSIL